MSVRIVLCPNPVQLVARPVGGPAWERRQTLCCTRFSVTHELPITVTATSSTGTSVHRPIFVEVLPEGAQPW